MDFSKGLLVLSCRLAAAAEPELGSEPNSEADFQGI